jgi:hypothetical protein
MNGRCATIKGLTYEKIIVPGAAAFGCIFLGVAQTGIFPGPGLPGDPTRNPRPLPSGVFGQSLFFSSIGPSFFNMQPRPGNPYQTYVTFYDEHGKFVSAIVSNPVGQFYTYLKPGKYTLLATPSGQVRPPRRFSQYVSPEYDSGFAAPEPIQLTVSAGRFTQVDVTYSFFAP